MSLTVGIDVIEMDRFENVYNEFGDKLLERVFTPAEVLSAAYESGTSHWDSPVSALW